MSINILYSDSILLLLCLLLITEVTVRSVAQSSLRLQSDPRSEENPNEVDLRCLPPVGVVLSATTLRFVPLDESNTSRSETVTSPLYTYKFTISSDTNVSCTADNGAYTSVHIPFAVIPVGKNNETKLLAFIEDSLSMLCQYPLGGAHTLIDPYHHIWMENPSTSDDGVLIPNENDTFLTIVVTEDSPRTYACAIKMRSCGGSLCPAMEAYPSRSSRDRFVITIVEKISNVTVDANVTTNEAESANFTCSARGTGLKVIWQYDGVNYTDDGRTNSIFVVTDSTADNYTRSTLVITNAQVPGNVTCLVQQSFDGPDYENFVNRKDLGSNFATSSAMLTIIPKPTTLPPSESTTTLDPSAPTATPGPDIMIILIILAIVIVVAVAFIVSLVLILYCHYHYKYKSDSSKLGRFLSRAISNKQSSRIPYQHEDIPSDSNGHVLESAFQSSPSLNYHSTATGRSLPQSSVHFYNGTQDQEQIYNTSQNSNVSGGSYSGLSGVSNQEPGVEYKMPYYCATEVSGGSVNPQTSISSGGLLVPPTSSIGRLQRSSDATDYSSHVRQSSSGSVPVTRLTHQALLQFQEQPPQKTVSYQHIPSQAHSAHVNGTQYPYLNQTSSQYRSDTGYVSQSNPQLSRPHDFQHLPSPALATVENTPNVEGIPPFPHNPAPTSTTHAPFPNEDSNHPLKLSDEAIVKVLDSLMHNRNCAIPNCICYSARQLYKARVTSRQRPTTITPVQHQSSSSSDSDSATDKRTKLFLPLSSQDAPTLHPHYHPAPRSRVRSANPRLKLTRRRSKSLDLTPVGECPEVSPAKTPKVGGSLLPGTPVYVPPTIEEALAQQQCSPTKGGKNALGQSFFNAATQEPSPSCYDPNNLNRLNSLSADDLPTLCLNDCPLVNTPKEEIKALTQPAHSLTHSSSTSKPALSTINEKCKEVDTDESNTSSRSDSPPNVTKIPHSNQINGNGIISLITSQDSIRYSLTKEQVERELSQGYQSETLSSDASVSMSSLKPTPKRNYSKGGGSDHSKRSTSPAYETYVTVSDDGSTVQTTEC